ncbi:MAG: hypothetical protein AAF587_00515 [Bacteroidota bacterium]
MIRLIGLLIGILSVGCGQQPDIALSSPSSTAIPTGRADSLHGEIRGGLLLTRFSSFEEFRQVVQVEYFPESPYSPHVAPDRPMVRLTHKSNGQQVQSVLTKGVSERDFARARDKGFWERLQLATNSPYAAWYRYDLMRVALLARWRFTFFGEGDVAFYDLAETMVHNIHPEDTVSMDPRDLSEKGYLNTFNHVTAQAMMTTLFSEHFADFIADSHERHHMPELITGVFTEEELADIDNGPVDNYVDIINNEWGQELGKKLKRKYKIHASTHWTPELLTDYLNDMQSYYSWSMQIGFIPFTPSDELMIRFSHKLNQVMSNDMDQFQ